jgi:hypothetical protein
MATPITRRIALTCYWVGMLAFLSSTALPCTENYHCMEAALWSFTFPWAWPLHNFSIMAAILSIFLLPKTRRGEARAVWVILLICIPTLWFAPTTMIFPMVRFGYFIWAASVTLITLRLVVLSHLARPVRIRRRKAIIACVVVLALTYVVLHPYCISIRFWQLQFAGRLPDDERPGDADLAEQAHWWGRRIDPVQFWSNKTVWRDALADAEAARYGRSYPPIPFSLPLLTNYSDRDIHGRSIDLSGGSFPSYVRSEREGAFWSEFSRKFPLPPARIESEQLDVAKSYVYRLHLLATDPDYAKRLQLTHKKLAEDAERGYFTRHLKFFPGEALKTNALFWTHVLAMRGNYQDLLSSGDGWGISNLFREARVDPSLIVGELTREQEHAAHGWRVDFLRRIKREGTSDHYIDAYLRAWKLDPSVLTPAEPSDAGSDPHD